MEGVTISVSQSHAVAWQHEDLTRTSDPDVCQLKTVKKRKKSEAEGNQRGQSCRLFVVLSACAEYPEEQVQIHQGSPH